ncbi:MAG: outer membrane beta-barrel protein, partial [Phaeodactylibacter sp.]|nr:outer membrane beta-barrel protein [Phaeodactylibacter sp.]
DPEKKSITQAAVSAYQAEKAEMAQTSLLNRRYQENKHLSSFQLRFASLLYDGDYPQAQLRPGADVGIGLFLTPRYQLLLHSGISQLAAERFYREDVIYVDLNLAVRLLPHDRLTPYFFGGGGALIGHGNSIAGDNATQNYLKANGGIGFEYHVNQWLGLDLAFDHNFIFSDAIDGQERGRYNDYFWRSRLGIKLFLN